jgi:hypothetical protein
MAIGWEEIFGPVASIIRAKDLNEAIKMVNSSNYGNSVCIFTSSGKAARDVLLNTQCGNIGINISIPCTMMWFPFYGMMVDFNYFCRLATIIFAGSLLSVFDCSDCLDGAAGPLRYGSWAH